MPNPQPLWTRTARRDLRAIHDFIARDSPHYARQTVRKIRDAAERLGRQFEMGSIVLEWDHPGIREVYAGSYRVIGLLDGNNVRILTVLHFAQHIPTTPPQSRTD